MTQLQPVLDGFNRTLENLSREVEGLSIDLKNLRHEQESMSKTRHAHEENREKDLEDNFEQMQQIWSELDSQRKEIEQTIHLKQEHLLHNMTNLKNKIDHKINMSHEEIQVTLLPSIKQPTYQSKLKTKAARNSKRILECILVFICLPFR